MWFGGETCYQSGFSFELEELSTKFANIEEPKRKFRLFHFFFEVLTNLDVYAQDKRNSAEQIFEGHK
jgi:hypothetical protein